MEIFYLPPSETVVRRYRKTQKYFFCFRNPTRMALCRTSKKYGHPFVWGEL